MDTNLVIPRGIDKTEVVFDFYFPDVSQMPANAIWEHRVGQRIQDEDVAICRSLQRGLNSRAYNTGRLRCDAKPASICFIDCSMRISRLGSQLRRVVKHDSLLVHRITQLKLGVNER